MSFPGLQAFQYSEVAAILPQYKKDIVKDKTNAAKVFLTKWAAPEKGTPQETTNYWPIAVAIGVILCLAGVFLTLAAYQVLPHGVNAISDLGVWGQVVGYGVLGIGFTITLVGAVKWYLNKHNSSVKSSVEDNEPDVSATHYNAEVAEMDSYFPYRIKGDELFAVDNSSRKEITIYYKEWSEDDQMHHAMPPVTFGYGDITPQIAFQIFCGNHADVIKDKHFIDLTTLDQRTQEFEAKRKERERKLND